MIKSYVNLTGKYLKANKKRTILTIIGIILSVALISSIGLFFNGIQVAEIEQVKAEYGSYHLIFTKTDSNLISKVINNPKVSRYGFYGVGEEIRINENLVVNEIMATDKALELITYRTKEGKLPQNQKEVAIEKWVLSQIDKNAKLGDKLRINNKEYTLVGILENTMQNQIDGNGILLTKNNDISKGNSALLVEISSKTNLRTAVKELKQLGEEKTVIENGMLLALLGANEGIDLSGLYMTIGIIVGIVLIATIAVIYNSFQISVVERIKQFGLLRAVGTTPKQIRKIVLREATIIALIGVPLGLLCGVIAIYGIGIAFKIIGADSVIPMKPNIDASILGVSAVVGLISIYLSALIPAFFAGKISPLVAISSRASITKEKLKRRRNLITSKLFGFEGAMAAKNIKRNKKRYRITVFSIVISVVLFVTFKSFMDMSFTVYSTPNESKNIHFSVIRDESQKDDYKIPDKVIDNLKAISYIDKIYGVYNIYYFDAGINKNSEVKEVQNIGGIYKHITLEGSEKTNLQSYLAVYDKNSLEATRKYIQSGAIDIDKLNKENGVILINKNRIRNENTKKDYFGSIANVRVGDEIELQYNQPLKDGGSRVEFGKGVIKKAKVMAILENEPFNFRGGSNGLKLITTEEVARNLTAEKDIEPINLNITIKDIKQEEKVKTEMEKVLKDSPSLQIINYIDGNRREKSTLLMVQILIYGFVIVVSLIGSVNIINTITTNIILRKREFSALKSIGLTQRGLKKMIVLEGLLYGVMGTIYGSIIGCGLSYLMYRGINDVRELGWPIPWSAILIAGAAALIIGYLSVLSPLSRIKKENLIEAIREDF